MSGKPSTTRVVKYIRRGVGISYTEVEYADSTSNKTAPTNGWQTNAPAWKNGHFIWQRIKFVYSDGAYQYSSPVCLSGGKGISSITEYYLATSASSGVTTSTSGWTTSVQAITATKKYLWNYEVVTYTNGSTTTTTPVIIGAYGDKGADAYSLDLDNEMDSVPCNVQLQTNSPSNQVYTTLTLYKGATAIDMGTPTIVKSSTALDVELDSVSGYSKRYKITVYDAAGLTETVTFKISVSGVTRNVVFTVNKIKPGVDGTPATIYRVEPSVTAVKVLKSGVATSAYVTCKKTKQTGNNTPAETTDGYLCVRLSGSTTDLSYSERYINAGVPVTNQSSIEFILYRSTTDKTVLDRETVPIISDGSDGKPGDKGDDGAGITAINSYYAISALFSGVTRFNISGWVKGTFQQPTPDNPYVWKYTETTYTNGKAATYTDCELIFTYRAGVNPNLLEDTDFRDDAHMGAWDEKLVTIWRNGVTPVGDYNAGIIEQSLQGRNAFRGSTLYAKDKIDYKEILRQPIIAKLRPSTWYTLSYWMQNEQDSLFYTPVTSAAYGFNAYKLYLMQEHKYRFAIQGKVSTAAISAGKSLRAYIYKADWSWSKSLEIKTTASSSASMEISDVPETGEYHISFYAYPNVNNTDATVTIERALVQNISMHTAVYVYPGVIDLSVKGFIDGAENTLPSDGATYYGKTDGFKFHTFTFKTKSTLPSEGYVLFRLWPNTVIGRESDGATGGIAYTDICMIKLEEGMMATGYVANEKSLMGDRGPMLRGPQAWSDCAVGYKFQAGGNGDEFKDVVLYNGNYYSCIKNHAKTANNYPTSTADTNNGYWKLGDKIELVATKILLATYALVKNLGVEAIDMKDANGNVIFQAKDGNVICKKGIFENVNIAGYLYKKKTKISQSNLSEYTTTDIFNTLQLDLLKSGTWVEFSNLSEDVYIMMPSIYPDVTEYTAAQKETVRSMIGNTVLINNISDKIIAITGNIKSKEDGSSVSVSVQANQFISLECKATVTNGYEDIYWLYKKGKIR